MKNLQEKFSENFVNQIIQTACEESVCRKIKQLYMLILY